VYEGNDDIYELIPMLDQFICASLVLTRTVFISRLWTDFVKGQHHNGRDKRATYPPREQILEA